MRKKYPDASPDAAFNYVMVTLVSLEDPGLVVLPTHRLIHSYSKMDGQALLKAADRYFDVTNVTDFGAVRDIMADADPELPRYGFYDGAYAVMQLKSWILWRICFPSGPVIFANWMLLFCMNL